MTEDCDRILAASPYFYNNRLIYMKKWKPGMKLTREFLNSMPVWINLPNLDLDFWSTEAISRIASTLGQPLRLENLHRISYARVLIEINIDFKFPEAIPIQCQNGNIVWQRVIYEWTPSACVNCRAFGHSIDVCKSSRVWIPKNNLNKDNNMDLDEACVGPDECMGVTVGESSINQKNMKEVNAEIVDVGLQITDVDTQKDGKGSCNIEDGGKRASSQQVSKNGDLIHFDVVNNKDNTVELESGEVHTFDQEQGITNDLKDNFMEESDCSSSSSFKRKRRSKFKGGKMKVNVVILGQDPLEEANHELVKLVSQFNTRSKTKKLREDGDKTGGVKNGGICKIIIFCLQ